MSSCEKDVYLGWRECTNDILKNEGFRSIFKGFGASALRGISGAIVLVMQDIFLRNNNKSNNQAKISVNERRGSI